MAPVIRISDETYARMERFVTFKDSTPESVIRKALTALENWGGDLPDTPKASVPKRNEGNKTPQRNFRIPMLLTLLDEGGSVPAKVVYERMKARLEGTFAQGDLESVSSGDARWWNATCWERGDLVRQGLLLADSPRGIWELSDAGKSLPAALHCRVKDTDKMVQGAGDTLEQVYSQYKSMLFDVDYFIKVRAFPDDDDVVYVEKNPTRAVCGLRVVELPFYTHTQNALANAGVSFVVELVVRSEAECLRMPGMGRKGLNQVKEVLAQGGLHLGYDLANLPVAVA